MVMLTDSAANPCEARALTQPVNITTRATYHHPQPPRNRRLQTTATPSIVKSHVSPTANMHDAVTAVELALAETERLLGHPLIDDALVDPDRSATKSRQSASVGSAWPRASRNPANALNSASWRLIVVLDLPAAINATITRADTSRISTASITIGLSGSDQQTRRFFTALKVSMPVSRGKRAPLLGRTREPDRTLGPVRAFTRSPRIMWPEPARTARPPAGTPNRPHNPAVHVMPLM